MRNAGHGASLSHQFEPLKLATDASINLGVIVTEWVTNAFKYAYPGRHGEVRVRLARLHDGRGELVVEDDGIGRADGHAPQGSGLGTKIVKAMAEAIRGHIDYEVRDPGTTARIVFPLQPD
jgi:two-component sensor histidine kinase